jgi:membrane-bound ClpP family serine protease
MLTAHLGITSRGATIPAGDRPGVDRADNTGLAEHVLTAPELGFGLIAVGLLATMLWTATPNLTKTGATGTALLLGGAGSLISAPTTPTAMILLLLAAASLWFEIRWVPGVGLYAISGWLALTLAGFTLHGTWLGAHPAVVLPLATLTAVGTYVAGLRSWQRLDSDPMASAPFLVDRHTVVLDTDGYRGHAVLAGQLWPIRSLRGPLSAGQRIRVVDITDNTLLVGPVAIRPDQLNH